MNLTRGSPYVPKHDVDFLIVALENSRCTVHLCIVSNLRAMGIFSLSIDELPSWLGQPRPDYVRNVVSSHFVAFIRSAKETPPAKRGLLGPAYRMLFSLQYAISELHRRQ